MRDEGGAVSKYKNLERIKPDDSEPYYSIQFSRKVENVREKIAEALKAAGKEGEGQ